MVMIALAMLIYLAEPPQVVTAKNAIGNPATWVTMSDYPPAALRAGETGAVGFTLEIGADGRATDCRITLPSGSALLDTATCRIMVQRAAFKPGDAARRYSSKIRWAMPPSAPINVTPEFPRYVAAETELVIGPGGLIESCRVIETVQTIGDPCGASVAGQRHGAGFRKDGKPVKAIIRRRVTVSTTFVDP